MIASVANWDDFERTVCSIIYKINPYKISRYDGGADRGRDIVAEFKINEQTHSVIIECKYYKSGVSKNVIAPALDWAKVHRPSILYFWIIPYLTPDTKDYIEQFEHLYGIRVLYEEQINIEQYLAHMNDDRDKIWEVLKEKVIGACVSSGSLSSAFASNIELASTEEVPYLIDREIERKTLTNPSKCAFYIQGISACGKTQLMKYISHIYTKGNTKVFWYTFRPECKETQVSSFFQTFAHYFAIVHNNSKLILYFKEYGYCLSRDLEELIIYLLKSYNTAVFLDDIHNCSSDNVSLIALFEKIIERRICKIYFAGWINIFSSKTAIKQNLSVVILDGMEATHLNQIISHYSGHDNFAVAGVIAEKFHGLPGYAVLVDEETTIEDLESDRQFLFNFLSLLSPKEQTLLFMLTFSSSDIPMDFLRFNSFSLELDSLKNKRLIILRGNSCSVHDKYKPFFVMYPIDNNMFSDVVTLMLEYAKLRADQYFDIITAYINRNNISQAWQLLSLNFKTLLHCQHNTQLLNLLQKIENANPYDINPSDIIFKKITLLERVCEYQLCLYYISMLDLDIFSLDEQESLLYIQMRALYFTNKYDDLLYLFKKETENILNFSSKENIIQILTIIGRVYYIRGLLNGALACYLLSYQYAFKIREKKLEAKIIHRIAMVECCTGLISESRMAFEALEKMSSYITPKRRSYIYYRIAKCFLLEGNIEEAKNYNEKSKKIKASYGDKRGLVFSNKLDAKISLAESDYINAACSIQQELSGVEDINVDKERLACMIVQTRLIIESDIGSSKKACIKCLQKCLDIAVKDKLLFRVKTIQQISQKKYNSIFLLACENYQKLTKELSADESHIINYCIKKMEHSIQKYYYTLTSKQQSITQRLLFKSGFNVKIMSLN